MRTVCGLHTQSQGTVICSAAGRRTAGAERNALCLCKLNPKKYLDINVE